MRRIASALVLTSIVLITSSLCFAAEGGITISVEGVRVVSKGYTGQKDMRAFSWSEGTTVTLMVFAPEGGIVDFKKDDSKLESMTDDKGNNLLAAEKKSFMTTPGFGSWPKISDDNKAVFLEVQGPGVPQQGAAAIDLKGKIVLSIGKETKTIENKDAVLMIDTKIKTGVTEMEINSVGKPSWGDMALSITFKGKGDLSAIKEVKFYDEAGTEIESKKGSTSSWGFGGPKTFSVEYQIKKKVGKATIKVTYWSDLKSVEVPLNIKVGIGVGK